MISGIHAPAKNIPDSLTPSARRTIEKITSDLSGDELEDGIDLLQFGFDGTQYEIDVTAKERRELEKALSKFIEAGRRVPQPGRAKKARATNGPDLKAVREWSKENKVEVPARRRRSATEDSTKTPNGQPAGSTRACMNFGR